MVRKNLLEGLLAPVQLPAGNSTTAPPRAVPAGLSQGGAIGSVSRSIEALRAEANEARELRSRMEAGQTILELATDLIDGSIIADRLESAPGELEILAQSIAEHGQQVPVLLRPHPAEAGRYQVAYGHRRVAAARLIGRAVRAVVRPLTDAELVIAQGQENSARTDLSFIERALFAAKLEDAGFDRSTIMAALGIDKTGASKLIAVARRIPATIIHAIGAAPKAGRDRWIALSERLGDAVAMQRIEACLAAPGFAELPSDARFLAVIAALKSPAPRQAPAQHWIEESGDRVARYVLEPDRAVLLFEPATTGDFAQFVCQKLPELYRAFRRTQEG